MLTDEYEVMKIATATDSLSECEVRDVIRVITAAGYAIVPVEPTEAMMTAGVFAYELTGIAGGIINTAEQHVALVYRAMLAASKGEKE